jgi:hypothetical protein
MPRLMEAGLSDALGRSDQTIESHSTLQFSVDTGSQLKIFHLATATLEIDGVLWRPDLRTGSEITASLTGDADEATLEIQNVDTLFGIQLVGLEEFLSGAEAKVGRWWKDLDRGSEWHRVTLTGLVTGVQPNEQVVKLTIVPDTYSGVSVGPFRFFRRLCQAEYKSFECGRPVTDPPTCDKTLNGNGGCLGRWGANNVVRHMGGPFQENRILQKII